MSDTVRKTILARLQTVMQTVVNPTRRYAVNGVSLDETPVASFQMVHEDSPVPVQGVVSAEMTIKVCVFHLLEETATLDDTMDGYLSDLQKAIAADATLKTLVGYAHVTDRDITTTEDSKYGVGVMTLKIGYTHATGDPYSVA